MKTYDEEIILKRIGELLLTNKSSREIAQMLNAEGFKTIMGKDFKDSTVSQLARIKLKAVRPRGRKF